MKCHLHNSNEAIGVCAHCGRALCRECVTSPAPLRLACSTACAEETKRLETAIELLVERSTQNARASAAYCYLSAVLSGGAAVAAWFWLPSPFLMTFAGGSALVLAAAGYWHGRAARRGFSAKARRNAPD
jgi:hypothetical protein